MSTVREHRFTPTEPVELYVENARGIVRIESSDDGAVHVRVTGQRADEFVIEADGEQVRVVGPRRGGFGGRDTEAEVRIATPDGNALAAKLGSSDLVSSAPLGRTWINSGSGDLRLASITGPYEVQSGSGDVTVEVATGIGRIKSGSGDVRLAEARGRLELSTGSGDVRLGHPYGPFTGKTGSGDVTVDEVADDLTLNTGTGDLVVGHARAGRLDMVTASGDVRIGITAGTPVWTDLSTVTGAIASDLPATGAPADGQDHVEVRARTATGDIALQAR